ncbi:hypothetical protein AVEN_198220-1 [Araneus ventricosus]|uniref:Uncharacterized protein n=1 Tax=Araneus ventricosus TaxID=182803 RepID=A0A4Y2SNC3_ARAVE|nr:hypothetical protein AVEN_198220-1 [Araneus ventricosus]
MASYFKIFFQPYYHAQPSGFGYAIRDHHRHRYRQEAGNGFGGLARNYGYADGRGNIQQASYGVSDRLVDPVIGYGNGGYGQGYGGNGRGNVGYSYGNALGFNALLEGYGDVYYGADLA